MSFSWHANSLLLGIDYSFIVFKYILHDMMVTGSKTRKVGHDLDFKSLL